jgi:methionyl-tRNA synthetase
LDHRGDIYKADYEGFYCVDCEEFKDEKEMDADKNCPTHRKPCQHRKEVGPGVGLKSATECSLKICRCGQRRRKSSAIG